MQRILTYMRKAIEEYKMIEEGDKIAICLSGGKDSITMLHAFKSLQRFYPKKFEIIAISIDPGFEFFDTQLLQNTCDSLEIPLFIEKSNAKEIVLLGQDLAYSGKKSHVSSYEKIYGFKDNEKSRHRIVYVKGVKGEMLETSQG